MISPVKGKPEIVAQYTDPSGQFTVSIQMISPVKGKSINYFDDLDGGIVQEIVSIQMISPVKGKNTGFYD
jgi:hypothetical protein